MSKGIIQRLRFNKRGVSTVIVVMLSLVLLVIVVGNVVLWSYQMNQLDWEKMQEKTALTNAESWTRSPWYTSQSEFVVNVGTRLNGTYSATQGADANYETFREESAATSYFPSGYNLIGSTRYSSGIVADLTTNNGVGMSFKGYSSAFSALPLYAHREVTTIAGVNYFQSGLNSSDSSGMTLQADASTTGRKLLAQSVYSLSGITSIPPSTWTTYYRAYKTGPDAQVQVHCDVNIAVRRADGTVRTTIASNVADSPNLNRDSYTTASATYAWSNYTVVDDTDYLEVDYYAHVTSGQAGRFAYLRIDDSGLAMGDQTRITGVMIPSRFTVEIELTGSSNTQAWQDLTWTVDNAFSTDNVNTTLLLYNYSASQYPTSGDGYVTYNSSPTPNTDEIYNQTITANPTFFRGAAGEWKIKIVGVKDTNLPYNLSVDWTEFKASAQGTYSLDFTGEFAPDLSAYPLTYVNSVEIQINYRTNDTLEGWLLKAYNWTSGQYANVGFNSTAPDTPSTVIKSYAVNLTDLWQNYIQGGTVRVKFCDDFADVNQTSVDVDFLGLRVIVDGIRFTFENQGPLTTHVMAIWMINATVHERYDANLFIDSGAKKEYIRADISFLEGNFTVKAVSERGNIAVFANH